ncbi:MAG: hypothetical protein R6U19_08165 [Bacteroidales bacterium]
MKSLLKIFTAMCIAIFFVACGGNGGSVKQAKETQDSLLRLRNDSIQQEEIDSLKRERAGKYPVEGPGID